MARRVAAVHTAPDAKFICDESLNLYKETRLRPLSGPAAIRQAFLLPSPPTSLLLYLRKYVHRFWLGS